MLYSLRLCSFHYTLLMASLGLLGFKWHNVPQLPKLYLPLDLFPNSKTELLIFLQNLLLQLKVVLVVFTAQTKDPGLLLGLPAHSH